MYFSRDSFINSYFNLYPQTTHSLSHPTDLFCTNKATCSCFKQITFCASMYCDTSFNEEAPCHMTLGYTIIL